MKFNYMNIKSTISIIGAILALILTCGCDKENCEPCITNTANDKSFIIGTESDFINITKFDSTIKVIAPAHDFANENFDVDKDGVNDFEIRSDHGISPGGVNYQQSSIKILNSSFQISVFEMSDTLHRCMQVAYDTLIAYVYYNNYSNYTCSGNGIDTTYSPNNVYYPSIHSTGDSLTLNENWHGDDLTFSYYDQSYHGWFAPFTSYLIVRGNWNNQNMKYVLFKKEYNDTELYGWLRLSIDNYKEIRIYEYAIQNEMIL